MDICVYVCWRTQLQQVQEYKRLFAYFCFTPALPGCTLPFFGHVLTVSQVKCPFGAMSCEVKLDTLQGSVITLDVPMTATFRELKSMLLEKHPCQDPIERKVLKVELLRDNSIIDDAESLDEAGLVGAEPPVTVAYARTRSGSRRAGWHPCTGILWGEDPLQRDKNFQRCLQGFAWTSFGHNPWNLSLTLATLRFITAILWRVLLWVSLWPKLGRVPLENCTSFPASISLGASVAHIGESAFQACDSVVSISLDEFVTHIGENAFEDCTSLASIS